MQNSLEADIPERMSEVYEGEEMTEQELRKGLTAIMSRCYSSELSTCPNHLIFQPQKAINQILALIKEAGYVIDKEVKA